MGEVNVSVTIITLNEEENLPRALRSVQWAKDVIVVDAGSTDSTVALATRFGARVFSRAWGGYGQQKNYAQSQAQCAWVLNIDADEEVSPQLAEEIREVMIALDNQPNQVSPFRGFLIARKSFFLGRWIQYGGWYPNRVLRLAHQKFARWSEPMIHEKLLVDGGVARLKNDLHHYPFESLSDQVRTNIRYAELGAGVVRDAHKVVRLRHLLLKPLGKFIETFFLKRGILDGSRGLLIALNAAHSIFLKYALVYEGKLRT